MILTRKSTNFLIKKKIYVDFSDSVDVIYILLFGVCLSDIIVDPGVPPQFIIPPPDYAPVKETVIEKGRQLFAHMSPRASVL